MKITAITSENLEQEVLKSELPVLVDFWADWCAPCKMLAPVIDELAKDAVSFKVCKVNVDAQPQLAAKYRIMGIPSLLDFSKGNVTNRSTGFMNKDQILSMIQEAL